MVIAHPASEGVGEVSLMQRRFFADKTIKYDPAKSVLKYKIGAEISLNEKSFATLSKAFFEEIEKKSS
jgi:hypothetical protein